MLSATAYGQLIQDVRYIQVDGVAVVDTTTDRISTWIDGVFQIPPAPDDDGTNLFLWAFASDDATDTSGNGNDGTLFNTPTHIPVIATISAHFSFSAASTEYINITNNITEFPDDLPLTYVSWIKFSDSAKKQIIFMGDTASNGLDNVALTVNADDTVSMVITVAGTSEEANGISAIGDGTWHHVVGVVSNDGNAQIFVDGVLEDTDVTGFGLPLGMDAIDVARKGDSVPEEFFEGEIARPQVLKVAWTPSDILADFNNTKTNFGLLGVGKDTNNGIAIWPVFYGDVVNDATGNGNHMASIIGATPVINTNGSIERVVFDFDGVNDRLLPGSVLSSNMFFGIGDFTISMWVRPDTTNLNGLIGYGGPGTAGPFELLVGGGEGLLLWRIRDFEGDRLGRTADYSFPTNEWTFVLVSWDANTANNSGVKIYINGDRRDDTYDNVGTFGTIDAGTEMGINM